MDMILNLERYKKDLEGLIHTGEKLLHSIQQKHNPELYKKNEWKEKLEKKNIDVKKLPDFFREYQNWYTEALVFIKRLIPDREGDFVELYKAPKNRKTLTNENYKIADYCAGLNIFEERMFQLEATIPHEIVTGLFHHQFTILKSARNRFESSLFDIKQLLQADLFDSELDAATELNKKGFTRAAGAVAGVVLESHLKQVCYNHKITIKNKNPTISYLNNLLKKEEVIDISKFRYIQLLTDWRNLCDHDKNTKPSTEIIIKLIKGVEEIIKTLS